MILSRFGHGSVAENITAVAEGRDLHVTMLVG